MVRFARNAQHSTKVIDHIGLRLPDNLLNSGRIAKIALRKFDLRTLKPLLIRVQIEDCDMMASSGEELRYLGSDKAGAACD